MIHTKSFLALLLIIIATVSGCTSSNQSGITEDNITETGLTVFANNYYRYDPNAYQQALSEGKVVFLFFRANWCPLCAAQRPKILAAFDELESDELIGFEVHYNDVVTKPFDTELAAVHQISYQDTKIVIDKTGSVVLKTLQHLEKDRIKSEIEAVL